MKLLSFIADGRTSFGAVKDDGVVDLGARMAADGCTTLRRLLETGRLADAAKLAASVAPDHPLDKITFAPVIPDPGKIICVGLNYRDHVAETGRSVTEKPALFARFACSQVGHLQSIVKPDVSDDFDYEASSRSSSARKAAASRQAVRSTTSPAMPATTKAASATGSGTPASSSPARPSQKAAALARGW